MLDCASAHPVWAHREIGGTFRVGRLHRRPVAGDTLRLAGPRLANRAPPTLRWFCALALHADAARTLSGQVRLALKIGGKDFEDVRVKFPGEKHSAV